MNLNEVVRIVIASVTIFLVTQCSAQRLNQQATLYDRAGRSIFLNNNSPDLRFQNFQYQTHSACLTGIWLFYENPNYNAQPGLMEYVFGPRNKCLNFQTIGGRISSVRLAGLIRDFTASTLTLYQMNYFQGQEENTISDLPFLNLDRRVASLIITGRAPWTVFSAPNFQGDAICIYPPPSRSNIPVPACVYDTNNVNIPYNAIRSVRLGCHSRKMVTASAVHPGTRITNAIVFNDATNGTLQGI